MFVIFINMKSATELTDMAYNVLEVLSKNVHFPYNTIDHYIIDAQKSNKSEIIEI